jgi:hypothetical protein
MTNQKDELKHAEELLLLRTAPAEDSAESPNECSELLLQSLGGPPKRFISSGDLNGNEMFGHQKVSTNAECSEILLQSLGGPPKRFGSSGDLDGNEMPGNQKVNTSAHLEKLANDEDARTAELVTRYSARPMPAEVASELERLAARQTVLKSPSSANRIDSQSWLS